MILFYLYIYILYLDFVSNIGFNVKWKLSNNYMVDQHGLD